MPFDSTSVDPGKTTVMLGPPGTGKTTRLIQEVEDALATGISPKRIAYISFTKKAAQEAKDRASVKFGIDPDDLPHFRTIHSTAFRFLGVKRDHMFSWKHTHELGKMLGMEFKGKGPLADDEVYGMCAADRMLFLEGLARNILRPLMGVWENAAEDDIDWFELERFSRALAKYKQTRMLSDYTDLLERFVVADPRQLPEMDLLILDEGQDLSSLQWQAYGLMAQRAKRILVAGDDCQAIYKWSGADVDAFINLPGRQVDLVQSYRIPQAVHALADSLTNRIKVKRARSWSPRPEVGKINWYNHFDEVDLSEGTWLLLARNGYLLHDLEEYCMTQGFPFRSVGRDPLKSESLEVIQIWENLRKGKDEAAERVLLAAKYLPSGAYAPSMVKWLKNLESSDMVAMPNLVAQGLKTTDIWHIALTRISKKERDFFIAVLRRKEKLLKVPRIHISTIHASKGGEADHVLLLTDMSYRSYANSQKEYDDEVRVWVVATTRCRKTLNIVMPSTNLSFDL